MRISVIGLGYVGAVTAACLARDGHEVLGVDLDQTKLNLLRKGQSPIIEEEIGEITRDAAQSGRLRVTDTIDSTIGKCDLIFVCVGTPSAPNGSQDLNAVTRVSQQIGAALVKCDSFPVVVMRSTVYPGSTKKVIQPILEKFANGVVGQKFGLCFQPEFLREGSSVKDFYNPPFTVIGTECERSQEKVRQLFASVPADFIVTSFEVAEMLKLTCNVFHALKTSFANEVGRLGKSLGVDSREVMDIFCKDQSLNISRAYLRPGFAYGGSCLPKDLRAMLYLARSNDVELPVMQGVQLTNNMHIQHVAGMVMSTSSRNIGIIGLSFKPGTDDLRESPLVALAELLIGKGYNLRIYDPAVSLARLLGSNKSFIEQTIPHLESLLTTSLADVIKHGDVLVVGQEHEEMPALQSEYGRKEVKIIDLVGVSASRLEEAPENYQGVCW